MISVCLGLMLTICVHASFCPSAEKDMGFNVLFVRLCETSFCENLVPHQATTHSQARLSHCMQGRHIPCVLAHFMNGKKHPTIA